MKCKTCPETSELYVSGDKFCSKCYFDKMMKFIEKSNINLELKSKIEPCGPYCYCVRKKRTLEN